jgi:hypothetical protein
MWSSGGASFSSKLLHSLSTFAVHISSGDLLTCQETPLSSFCLTGYKIWFKAAFALSALIQELIQHTIQGATNDQLTIISLFPPLLKSLDQYKGITLDITHPSLTWGHALNFYSSHSLHRVLQSNC